jgi:hypothetical protein
VRLEPLDLFVQQLHVHGRFAQFLAETDEVLVAAIERLLLQRSLASGEERLTPGRDTGGGYPQCACHYVERFPTEETEDDFGLLPRRKPPGLLPSIAAPLSSRSASSLRGDLYGNLLWMHLDTSSE